MFANLAWRNIWRVPRRTLIILLAVISGVWAMINDAALMKGITDQMVVNNIKTLTGHIQIHKKGYYDDPVIEHSMTVPDEVYRHLGNLPDDVYWTKRVRVPGIVSNARNSASITIVGITPEEEARVSFIKDVIADGRYLKDDDLYGVVAGKKLAEKFETGLGKKLVLMSQDSEGEIASGGFRIVGIYDAEFEATEEQFVFIILSSAQNMLKSGKSISEISILSPHHNEIANLQDMLLSQLPDKYEILNWQQLLPLVKANLEIYNVWTYIWFLIVFIAIAFGLVNTMLMAVFERTREFGMLKAIGMKPRWLIMQILLESFCLLIIGIIMGDLISWATIAYLSQNGIDMSSLAKGAEAWGISRVIYPALHLEDILLANAVVLIFGIIVTLYPAFKASRILPVKAMAYM